ncbi:MAG: hypothetical protein K6T87_14415 [Roseiflexus sp.]|uniref:hypothetical protein n=1 Tax=Roseiflexus sp. TaxID=2562120 RepID=UPI0025E54928|nr:hypothetical protein [Roseiflexus sp.]MCL6541749.1 hypothetical protein [Roseiflexus sp.]
MSQSKRNPHLPPWLQDVPLPPKPPDVDQPASGAPLFAGLPEWLRDEDEAPPSATPDWLSQTPEPSHPEPDWLPVPDQTVHPSTETTAPPEISPPSWLQSLRATIVPPEEEAGAEPPPFTFAGEPGGVPQTGTGSDIEAPSWLIGEQPTRSDGGEDVEAPSWLIGEQLDHGSDESPEQPAGSTFPPASGAVDESIEPVDLPAWLRELPIDNAAQASPSPQTASRGEELPAWLRQDEPSTTALPEDARSAGDLPDWLRDIAATPSAPPAAPPASDLPDWLRDIAATPSVPPAAPPASDLPDWLRDIAAQPPAPPAAPSAPVAETAPPAGDLPDWLRDIAAQPPAAPSAPVAETAPPAGDLPDWLRDIAAQPPAPPVAPVAPVAETAPPASDLPDWLRDIAAAPPAPPAAPSAPVAETAPPAGDLPDWLRDIAAQPPAPPAAPSAPVAETTPPTGDLPDWLRDIAAQPPAPPAAPSAPVAETASPAGDLPDWLTGALSTPDIPSVEEKPVAPPSTPSDLPDWLQAPDASPGATGLPDWLRGAEVPAATDAYDGRSYTTEPAALRGSSDLLSGMDLPEWLRVEPEPKPEPPPLSGRDLDWLTRLGSIAEDETITGVTVATPKLPPPPAPKRTEEQVAALNLLSRLAAEPIPAATPLPLPEPTGALQRIGLERMLSMILLILVIVAILVPGLFPALETPPAIPGASEIYRQIAALGANDVVLIGYEWDARRVGELRPLEQAVIGQLIAQNVKLILVSTDPQGTLLQFDLLDTLRQAGYRQQGEGYLLLGYKPGGEMALRMVGRDFQTVLRSDYRGDDATGSVLITGVDTGRPIARLNDLSLIIVLADDTPDVQGWMEQVYPQAQTGDRPVSLVFLLPEEAAPIVQPYMRQPGVTALAGRRGALAYAALGQNAGSFDPMIARSIAQQRLATLLFALVLLFGLAGVGVAALRRRRS